MGVGRRGREAPRFFLWIFMHDTDKVEGSLMVLFFGLVFALPPLGNFSADALSWVDRHRFPIKRIEISRPTDEPDKIIIFLLKTFLKLTKYV